ncbi:MAG: segregation ATPase FtsK/SpoIIIE, family [Pseudonocardiales bacterium]|jgi:S-DNA-T family DNA segregation ATPase FtsK/SpoIIIE|nr:segregation ATPase FtsK/SpoIIIE, family [Pseudonocardiales bacterium]
MIRGQDVKHRTDHTLAFADALGAHRVAVTRARPGVLTVVIERRMPVERDIVAAPIPVTSEEVDLDALDVGDNERGVPFLLRVRGKHVLVVGASGAGNGPSSGTPCVPWA